MFFHQHSEISIFVDPKYFGSVAFTLSFAKVKYLILPTILPYSYPTKYFPACCARIESLLALLRLPSPDSGIARYIV